jgi:hypothetical protein
MSKKSEKSDGHYRIVGKIDFKDTWTAGSTTLFIPPLMVSAKISVIGIQTGFADKPPQAVIRQQVKLSNGISYVVLPKRKRQRQRNTEIPFETATRTTPIFNSSSSGNANVLRVKAVEVENSIGDGCIFAFGPLMASEEITGRLGLRPLHSQVKPVFCNVFW